MSDYPYTLIETDADLRKICLEIKANSNWMGFDTEFIGERRYIPLLCLIQISSSVGNFIIDALEIQDFQPFCDLISDEKILKITHAGENDYQLCFKLFGVLPNNVVDVQVAVGFLGDGYPTSFQKLASKYAKVRISKSQTVTDWKNRPISQKQLKYALYDVVFLEEIWDRLKGQLEKKNRLKWVIEECQKMCDKNNYSQNPLRDVLNNKIMHNLSKQERLFFIRLILWKERTAAEKNISREQVLSSKVIPVILKTISSGKKTLIGDRRIPDHIIKKHWDTLNELFQAPQKEGEQELLDLVAPPPHITDEQNILMDLLNQIFKFICTKNKIAGTLLMPRSEFNRMKYEPDYVPPALKKGWRNEVLGKDMVEWLENRTDLDVTFKGGELRIAVNKD